MKQKIQLILLLLGISLTMFAPSAWADCSFQSGTSTLQYQAVIPSLRLAHHPAADTVLWTSEMIGSSTAKNNIICSSTQTVYAGYQTSKTLASNIASGHVYQTNNPGIGIRIGNWRNSNGTIDTVYLDWPRSTEQARPSTSYAQPVQFKVQLIATGQPVSTGILDLSNYSVDRTFGSARQYLLSFLPTTVNVQSYGCDLETKEINVPLTSGKGVSATSLSEPGDTTPPVDFDIALNCEETTDVSIKFSGTTISGAQNILALDNPEQATSAKGVGVQILQNDELVNFGEEKALLTNVSNAQVTLPFQARLIRLSDAIGTGEVNATATFDMIYR